MRLRMGWGPKLRDPLFTRWEMQRAFQAGLRQLSAKSISSATTTRSLRRNFAREAKKSYEAPPDPPSSSLDKLRLPLLLGLSGGFVYIFMMPSNDHGLFETSQMPAEPPARTA